MMPKVYHLPAFLLSVSFLSALLAVSHGAMVLPKWPSLWLVILAPVVLGAVYSFLLHRMSKGGAARSVFRSSLLVVVGFALMFLWMLSLYYFPNLYPDQGSGNVDFGYVIYLGTVFLAVPLITLYSIYALWLPTKLASEKPDRACDGRVIAILHGGGWGLLLVLLCFAISYPTNALFAGSYEQTLRDVVKLLYAELAVCMVTFLASGFMTAKRL
jgi:hypothetical protein